MKDITTIEQLKAIPRSPERLGGPLIKAMGYPSLGDVYEGNDDGTWCLLHDGSDTWERSVPCEDIALPAVLIWEPDGNDDT